MPFLFPFSPNWNSSFKVELAYKTEIITSRNYREQRNALRSQPRKRLSFSVTPRRGRLTTFLAEMAARQQAEYVVPEVTRSFRTNGAVIAGANTFAILGGGNPAWTKAGSYLVIDGVGGFEMILVAVSTGGNIVADQPFASDIPSGTKVFPGLVGRFDQSLSGKLLTNMTGDFDIDFEADPGLNSYEAETTAPITFNGRELFMEKPNWRTAPVTTFEGLLETTDYGRGRVEHHTAVNFNTQSLRLEFLRRDPAAVESLCQFVHRMKGQQGEFYMPTWGDDFDLSIGAAVSATVLNVPGVSLAAFFSASPIYKAAIAFFADGTYQANRIVSLAPVSGQSRFTFASPWAKALNDTTVRMMCWLPAWRLAIDTLTLDWPTSNVAQTQLTAQMVEDLA